MGKKLWQLAVLVFVISFCLCSITYSAGIPIIIDYNGLVKSGGSQFGGTGLFKFAIINSAGTTSYWSNDSTSTAGSEPTDGVSVTVTNGVFNVLLGDTTITNMNTLPASVFQDNSATYLRVWFNDGTSGYEQLTPDKQIVSVPYAYSARNINSDALYIDQTNNRVGIGTTAPNNTFQVADFINFNNDGSIALTAIGYQAAQANTTGGSNTAIGYEALNNNTEGNSNTAVGTGALALNVSGNRNTVIGKEAGSFLTSGDNNIIIGYRASAPNATGDSQLNIGDTIYGDLASGFIGIGTTSPGVPLDAEEDANTVANFNRTGDDGTIITFEQDGAVEGDISVSSNTVSYNGFTGSHFAWSSDKSPFKKGSLLIATGNNKTSHNNDFGNGEVVYEVTTTDIKNDKRVLGVYLCEGKLGEEEIILVNAVGNSFILVTDTNGNIELGDFLTSSSISGHAQKQTESMFMNYTIGKALQTVNWDEEEKDHELDYKWKLITCSLHAG